MSHEALSMKLKKYKKAYEKCIKKCKKSKSCKTNCDKFLSFDFQLQHHRRSKSMKKKKSLKKSPKMAYQQFVKEEYKNFTHLDNKERFKQIALKWKKSKKKQKKKLI
jgi:hypothetical protein